MNRYPFFVLEQPLQTEAITDYLVSYDKQQRGPAHKNHQASVAVAVDAMPMWNDFSQSPVYSSSSGQTSPIPGPHEYIPNVYSIHPYGSGPNRTRTPSNASMYEPWTYNTPRSPVSTNSTLPYAWPTNDKVASGLAYMNTSYPMTSLGLSTNIDPMAGYHFGAKTMIQRDDGEGMTLFPEPYGMGQVTHLYPHEQYLNNYWRLFHPTFPVVHRPTFEGMSKSPMLYAAMIAIGGQYSTEATVKQKSRLLHDQCIKLLEMVSSLPHIVPQHTLTSCSVSMSQWQRMSERVTTKRLFWLKFYLNTVLAGRPKHCRLDLAQSITR